MEVFRALGKIKCGEGRLFFLYLHLMKLVAVVFIHMIVFVCMIIVNNSSEVVIKCILNVAESLIIVFFLFCFIDYYHIACIVNYLLLMSNNLFIASDPLKVMLLRNRI